MKYIDKSLNRQKGEQIVTEFLDCFHKERELILMTCIKPLVLKLMMFMVILSFVKDL